MKALLAVVLLVLLSPAPVLSQTPRAHPSRAMTNIVLADLPEGAPLASLYARDNVIYDGGTQIQVDLGRPLRLLGRISDGDYAVQTIDASGNHGNLFRVDGETGKVVRFGRSYDLYREPRTMRGGRYMVMNNGGPAPSKFGVLDTETGDFVITRHFSGYSEMIDAAGSRVLVVSEGPPPTVPMTLYWFPFKDRVRLVSKAFADPRQADAKHGLAVLAPGADDGSCPALVRTTRPNRRVWETCRFAPLGFSPNGRRLVGVPYGGFEGDKGLTEVQIRSVADGSVLRRFRGVEIESLHWDGDDHLAMVVHDDKATAAVRCDLAGACERVSPLVPEPRYEYYGLDWTFPVDREGWDFLDEAFYYDGY